MQIQCDSPSQKSQQLQHEVVYGALASAADMSLPDSRSCHAAKQLLSVVPTHKMDRFASLACSAVTALILPAKQTNMSTRAYGQLHSAAAGILGIRLETHPLSYLGLQCLLTLFFSCTAASHLALWSTCWLPTTACSTTAAAVLSGLHTPEHNHCTPSPAGASISYHIQSHVPPDMNRSRLCSPGTPTWPLLAFGWLCLC
jgi:hypothetical protein